eukprot:PhF_6_TR31767/c0_g1_i1/m.46775
MPAVVKHARDLTSRMKQNFNATQFPFYTSTFGPNYFQIFALTSDRILVHRGATSTPNWESRLLQECGTPIVSNYTWVDEKLYESIGLHRSTNNTMVPPPPEDHEKLVIVQEGRLVMHANQNTSQQHRVLLYASDAAFVPYGWTFTLASNNNSPRTRFITKYFPKPFLRQGHVVVANYLQAEALHDEREFMRKQIRRARRWDEVTTGEKKVFT